MLPVTCVAGLLFKPFRFLHSCVILQMVGTNLRIHLYSRNPPLCALVNPFRKYDKLEKGIDIFAAHHMCCKNILL